MTDALKEKVGEFPKTPGVYLMKDAQGRVIYVGKAKSLRDRVASYFQPATPPDPKRDLMLQEVADIEYLETASEVEALLAEARLIKDSHPRYNVRLRDDKSFPYLEITREDFPRVRVTRNPDRRNRNYGPFTDVYGLRQALTLIRRIFKFCDCSLEIRTDDPKLRCRRPCLYYYLGACSAPGAGKISKEEYRENIRALVRFLDGKQQTLLRDLRAKMEHASADLRFEDAAKYRNQTQALEALAKRDLAGIFPVPEVLGVDPRRGLQQLEDLFHAETQLRTIEGIDISNLGPDEAVGSLVSFVDGQPFKAGYRRFRIKTVTGQDDLAMTEEVVSRHFRRIEEEGRVRPDILLIDGGPGQLRAAQRALKEVGAEVPLLLSLAKEEEIIHSLEEPKELRLPRTAPGLKVLQFVRDEAHRFAQHYHHILRRKKLVGDRPRRQGRSRARPGKSPGAK
jgi:excinuclease ABC subunit C